MGCEAEESGLVGVGMRLGLCFTTTAPAPAPNSYVLSAACTGPVPDSGCLDMAFDDTYTYRLVRATGNATSP